MTAYERIIRGYVNLIRQGKITLDDVPEKFRDDVEKALQS